jgi:hypothetical protein
MVGKNVWVDTNILIYLIGGEATAAEILQGRRIHISFITEIELLSFQKLTTKEEAIIEDILKDSINIQSDRAISRTAAILRKKVFGRSTGCNKLLQPV